ncbi:MAG TPA: hypothetical protein VIF10_11415 [Methylobacter sp.]|jgi:hypothetical protein
MNGYLLIAASGGKSANTNKHSSGRINGRRLIKEACDLYDQLNDKIMDEGNKLYVCAKFKERLCRLAIRAHKRYMRRQGRFHADE